MLAPGPPVRPFANSLLGRPFVCACSLVPAEVAKFNTRNKQKARCPGVQFEFQINGHWFEYESVLCAVWGRLVLSTIGSSFEIQIELGILHFIL